MNSSTDIAIIGRGIAGLSAAYRLADAGFRPTVFGERDGLQVASRCAQGVLCNKGLFFAQSPLFRAKLASLSHVQVLLQDIEDKSGQAIPRFFKGVEEPYWSPDDFRATASRVYRQRFWGCHGTVNRPGAFLDPNAQRPPLGRLFYPRDGWFDVPAMLDAIEIYLKNAGVHFDDQNVERLERHSNGGVMLHANKGSGRFDRVVLAAGAGLRNLWPQLGLPSPKTFAIAGQTLRFRLPEKASAHVLVKGSLSLAIDGQNALLGSSSLQEGMPLDEDRDLLARRGGEAFGYLIPTEAIDSRFGVRLRFSDRMPLVGFAPEPWGESLYFLAGFYKNGVHLADICAQEMMRDFRGEARLYPDFSFARFQ